MKNVTKENYVKGEWTDSTGSINTIRYKRTWGEHYFTDEENNKLLAGKEISFLYKGRLITGHLQYYPFQGREIFGFKSDYPIDEYDKSPVFHKDQAISSFEIDLERENHVMSEYMRVNYYSRLLNKDSTAVVDYDRITDVAVQKDGIDVTYTVDGKRYIVDEKAQMDYIYRSEPLPTFSLELLNSKSGNIGWLLNTELKTEYYMFIWPHAEGRPLTVDKILYAYYALINKNKLLIEIEKRYKMDRGRLLEYAKRMVTEKMGEEVTDKNGKCIGYRYKGNGFDNQAYLYYTVSKSERPVNLVVKRDWLYSLSESHGVIKR